jgi:hypothetical protein
MIISISILSNIAVLEPWINPSSVFYQWKFLNCWLSFAYCVLEVMFLLVFWSFHQALHCAFYRQMSPSADYEILNINSCMGFWYYQRVLELAPQGEECLYYSMESICYSVITFQISFGEVKFSWKIRRLWRLFLVGYSSSWELFLRAHFQSAIYLLLKKNFCSFGVIGSCIMM